MDTLEGLPEVSSSKSCWFSSLVDLGCHLRKAHLSACCSHFSNTKQSFCPLSPGWCCIFESSKSREPWKGSDFSKWWRRHSHMQCCKWYQFVFKWYIYQSCIKMSDRKRTFILYSLAHGILSHKIVCLIVDSFLTTLWWLFVFELASPCET